MADGKDVSTERSALLNLSAICEGIMASERMATNEGKLQLLHPQVAQMLNEALLEARKVLFPSEGAHE